MKNVDPDDPQITDMDPIKKMWMFENWIADKEEAIEAMKTQSYLIGQFIDSEAVRSIISTDNKHISSDEEFDETSNIVRDMIAKEDDKLPKRRKRRKLNG